MQQEKHIIKIEKKEAESEGGSIGKYLNKHITPGRIYAFEGDTNLVGTCLYNIDKPMMVITYKSYEQFLRDATISELAACLSDSEKTTCNITDEMIAKKQLELVKKPIKYKTGVQSLNDKDLLTFGLQMKGHKIILIDDYQTIVEDWYQETSHDSIQTQLQEYGITIIAPKHPQSIKEDELVEMAEPVLWITNKDRLGAENRLENVKIVIVKMKDCGENDDLGAALKRSLVPSQLYVIDKTPEIATSFYYSLFEPTAVFTITKSSTHFYQDLLWSRVETSCQRGGIDPDDIGKTLNALENRPMWIDDTMFQSVADLCEKCRQLKEERNIQFVVIDDFVHLPIPESVLRGLEEPDAVNKQLCRLAKELDIAVVALVDPSANDTNEHHQPRRRRNRNQAKGLDAILRG